MTTADIRKYPLILVHGINDTGAVFDKMADHLRKKGHLIYILDLIPNNGSESLINLAKQLYSYINRTFNSHQIINLIGFSMGGIVSRYYIQRLGGIERVEKFITISSPHQGTIIAYGSWLKGCMEMRPNSAFLQDLNSDIKMLNKLKFTSIWTPYDLMIIPATSSQIGIGQEITIPILLHPWMLTDQRIIDIVAEQII
ncbi:alpha/beta fold hydrolase [Anabaena sp. FACHB-1237]|uniref:esterase/lipase family protein n=1 Tax=Anabaena sp. FACHB-1237 TaxID=2692769 RepID=UPI00168020EB|nr:alpha/beta fold hydrolase [Anabaena sp. FACHB-1237]MBD2137187.1 alpha/beta fold hydrolase [Anabaena sp. FACHB-1237]